MVKSYRVIKAYSDAPQNPISVIKGEVLEKIQESDPKGDWPNWVFCRGKDKEGWIPRQILEIEGNRVTAMEDYCAREFNLTLGETLVAQKELNGWIWGYKSNGPEELGWAPLNCLEQKTDH